jgi:hypothetical protein
MLSEFIIRLLLCLGRLIGMILLLLGSDLLHFLFREAAVAVFADELLILCRKFDVGAAIRALVA